MIGQFYASNICLIGDFNSILHIEERVGVGSTLTSRDKRDFLAFVENCKPLDIKLQGRKYTWYRSNDTCKSRIDRALINERWADTWSSTSLCGLKCSISDHCPIILSAAVANCLALPIHQHLVLSSRFYGGCRDLLE